MGVKGAARAWTAARGRAWPRTPIALWAALNALAAGPILAQGSDGGRAGPRAVMEPAAETALALSAAPARVSADASVLLWTGEGFRVGRDGTNGVTCYVARSWPDSLEPHCFDAEGSRTILPIHLRQMELWHDGRTPEEIEAEIAEGLRTGAFRLPERPAMSYMMSKRQRLISDDGRPVGAWEPHLMIYYPWLTDADLGLGGPPSSDGALVVDPGTPLSNIMIIVPDFATPAGGSG
jgi:hypothetical protein